MATRDLVIEVSGLGKTHLAALREHAKELGMSAERYARQLIEEGISLERRARTKTFDELFGAAQARFRKSGMSESDLDELVNGARQRSRGGSRKRKA